MADTARETQVADASRETGPTPAEAPVPEVEMDRRSDLAVGVGVVLFGVFLLVATQTLREDIKGDLLGPRAFPTVLGAFITAGGAYVVFRALRHVRGTARIAEQEGEPDEPGIESSTPRAFAVMASTLVYGFLLDPLGYPLATPLYLAGALWLLTVRNRIVLVVLPLLLTAALYYLFAQVFQVAVPTGVLTELFRQLGLR